MQLDVHPENQGAIGFYRAGGFFETGRIEVAGPGDLSIPHVVLTRKLDMRFNFRASPCKCHGNSNCFLPMDNLHEN